MNSVIRKTVICIAIITFLLIPTDTMAFQKIQPVSDVQDGYIGIYTAEELSNIRNNLEGKYMLMNDIIFSEDDFRVDGSFYNEGQGWIPIGETINEPFKGILDGNGHSITGISFNMNNEKTNTFGLFGYNYGQIKNVEFHDFNMKLELADYKNWDMRIGLIAGYMPEQALIDNCYVSGNITINVNGCGENIYAGGIAGTSYGKITDCNNATDIDLDYHSYEDWWLMRIGGIAGGAGTGALIEKCGNKGNINAEIRNSNEFFNEITAGGIVGYMWGTTGTLQKCYNLGQISLTGNDVRAGGIAGQTDSPVNDCFNVSDKFYLDCTNSYHDRKYIGGITGVSTASIMNCYNIGSFPKGEDNYYGGILSKPGVTTGISISNCYYDDRTVTGAFDNNDTGTALSLSNMSLEEHFEGFDFDKTWTINGSADSIYSFPVLKDVQLMDFSNNITFNKNSASVTYGKSYTQLPTSNNDNLLKDYVWRSSDKSVATVDKNGKVTFKKLGTVRITAGYLYNNYSASYKLTCVKPDLKATESVTAKLYGHDDVNLTWKKVTGASGYYVYYKKSTWDTYKCFKSTTATSCKIANLTDGAKYYFRIYPYINIGGTKYRDGSYKVSSYIYTLKKVKLNTVKRYSGDVKLSWNNISGESGYKIYRATSKYGTYKCIKTVKADKKYVVVGAKNNKTYYYKIRAYKKYGTKYIYGPYSSVFKYKL